MRALRLLTLLLVGAGSTAPALADDACPPAQLVTSVDIKLGDDGRIYVPFKVNGVEKHMLLDTGGMFSEITQTVTDSLKLPTRASRVEFIGAGGDTTSTTTRAAFVLGNLYGDGADFVVIPPDEGFADDITDVAGTIAPSLLRSYDVEIDLTKMKLSLYSQDHCDGKAVHWAGAMAVLPMRINSSYHIEIPVQLDGHDLIAMLDTGATSSVLDQDLAETKFGLKLGDADTPEYGALLRSPGSKTYTHQFKSLSLEGIAVADPTVHLIPDLMRNKLKDPRASLEGGSRIAKSSEKAGFGDMILGMNVLRQWHIYIGYKEQKVYLTHAPEPVFVETEKPMDERPAAVRAQPAQAGVKQNPHPNSGP
jgi:predicted aspartyl protease